MVETPTIYLFCWCFCSVHWLLGLFMCCFWLLVLLFGVFFVWNQTLIIFAFTFFKYFLCLFLFNTKVLYAEDRFIESFWSNFILNVFIFFLHYMFDNLSLNGGTSAVHGERYLEPARRRYFIPDKNGYDWACLRAFHI